MPIASHRKLSKTPDRSSAKPSTKTRPFSTMTVLAPSSVRSICADRISLGQIGAETRVTWASIVRGDSKELITCMSKSQTASGSSTYEFEHVTEVSFLKKCRSCTENMTII
eukprot:Colp12_sorted_trinity150504_noHs@35141